MNDPIDSVVSMTESIYNSKLQLWVQNLMIDVPNFAQNASFQSLLKLSQTSKDMRERLLPILKAKRIQELETLQTWLATLNINYTLINHLLNRINLVITWQEFMEIPPEIGQLTNLEILYLESNKIIKIPPEIGLLTNLKHLYLSRNQITSIPPEIGQLTNLTHLWLARNQITEIPPEIGQLTNLKVLDLAWNQIMEIPPDLFGEVSKAKPAPRGGSGQEAFEKSFTKIDNGFLIQQHNCNLDLNLYRNKITAIPPNLKRPGLRISI